MNNYLRIKKNHTINTHFVGPGKRPLGFKKTGINLIFFIWLSAKCCLEYDAKISITDDVHQEETTNNESMITAATAATAASDDKEAADKDDKSKNSESNNKPTSYVTERSNILNDIIINNNI